MNITPWPRHGPITQTLPKKITRPCDAGLELAIVNLETQLGSIEAYNRLAAQAHVLRERIEHGDIKPQNPLYAKSVWGDG